MIMAKKFAGKFDGVYKIPYNRESLYNVLLETHNKMMVNNLICETLNPENPVAQLYTQLQRIPKNKHSAVIEEFNRLCIENNLYGTNKNTQKKEFTFKMSV